MTVQSLRWDSGRDGTLMHKSFYTAAAGVGRVIIHLLLTCFLYFR